MSSKDREVVVRRILVGLDASPHSMAALEAAAELAARLEAEMLGLFVEDVDLLRLSELPFAQEVCVSTTTRRRLRVPEVERQLRAQAARMRRSMATHAQRAHVRWSFQVTRGIISHELVTAASRVDLITVGKAGRSLSERRLGSTAKAVLAEAPCLTLIVQEGGRLRLPVMVIYDGSPQAQKALDVAAALLRGLDTHIVVLVLADDKEAAQEIKTRAAEHLKERELMARYRWLIQCSLSKLVREVQMERGGMLVLPGKCRQLQGPALHHLLDELDVPVLLVR